MLFGGSPTAFDDQMGWYNGTYNIILIVMYALLFFPSLKNVAYLQWLSNIVVALKLFILICFFIGSFTGLGME